MYSKTLMSVSSARTRIERDFEPEAIREFKAAAKVDLTVGGPELAGQAFQAGLVDECHQIFYPIVVGGGKGWLPTDLRLKFELVDERCFGGGMVYLRYRTNV